MTSPGPASTARRRTTQPNDNNGNVGDAGAVTVLLLLLTTMLLALAGLVWDGGRAISGRQEAAGLAEQAARAGADVLDLTALRATGADRLDSAGARTAACRYLAVAAPQARCSVTVAATEVTVDVTTNTRTVLLSLVGIHELRTHGQASARPVRGVVTEVSP